MRASALPRATNRQALLRIGATVAGAPSATAGAARRLTRLLRSVRLAAAPQAGQRTRKWPRSPALLPIPAMAGSRPRPPSRPPASRISGGCVRRPRPLGFVRARFGNEGVEVVAQPLPQYQGGPPGGCLGDHQARIIAPAPSSRCAHLDADPVARLTPSRPPGGTAQPWR